ncbi:SCO1/SenC-like protein [Helicosporidium sp. ATCC 50920]|nr:SCO1/SenC-like protein [Helicosporidium sp. ATCC 50920]|eukprot:KDD75817.1 SCO1/SenC-like protein [Helicosporidium sp. ATCC 50920]
MQWQASSRSFSSESGKRALGGPVSLKSLALTFATGGAVLYYFNHARERKLVEQTQSAKQVGVGAAAIGGPFELVDQDSKKFTDADLRGEFALIYFGFTHCPDICPEELEKISGAIDAVEKSTSVQIKPVFISIDPERDVVKEVKAYVKKFHPRMIGLTGTPEQCQAAARRYRVYYSKTTDSATDYLVDHSIISYLLDPEGKFLTFYGKNMEAEQIATSMAEEIKAYQARTASS